MNEHKGLLKECTEVCELGLPMAGLISEEEVPSLYSLSLSDSVCSSSTVDLGAVEQSGTYPRYGYAQHVHSSPLENNFMEEKEFKTSEIHQTSTSKTTLDMSNSLSNASRNCISLHDVSSLTPSQLPENSTNTVSCETIHSHSMSSTTKSKDSGFQRSDSCLSLNCGRRNYDHVESKVKAYIKNIKDSEALRKQEKMLAKNAVVISEPTNIVELDSCVEKEELVQKVQELEDELHIKALFINTQQKNYNTLLLKLAEAKNTIDALRVQKISLNYNSTNEESRNSRIGDIDLGVFEQEISRQQNKLSDTVSSSCESNINPHKCLVASKPANNSYIDTFKPKTNSTPKNKDSNKYLSPVSKISSSSSRLDKGFRPLASLKKSSSVSLFHNSNRSNAVFQCPAKKVSNFSTENKNKPNKILNGQKKSTLLCNKKHVTTNIDLPNVDPFDKVKKWQASLPSINLLGTQSSSDCDDSVKTSKSASNLQGHTENEINSCLSLELMSKLKISEEPLKSSSRTTVAIYNKKTMAVNPKNISVKYTSSNFESMKNQTRGNGYERVLCATKRKSVKCSNPNFQTVAKSSIPSTSECESQRYLPKSSSWSCALTERQLKSDSSDTTEDSSSITSSVSSSRESLSLTMPSKSSMKFPVCKSKTEVKLHKPFTSNFANTKVVLQKPKLNYEPMTNISNLNNDKILQKKTQPLNNSTSNLKNLKVESSQRKAWNERNTTNFSVCKELRLRRSSSLQECLNIMQDMIEEGSSIIGSTLERSHCH